MTQQSQAIIFLVPIDEPQIWEYQANKHKIQINRLCSMMAMSVKNEADLKELIEALKDSEHRVWGYVK